MSVKAEANSTMVKNSNRRYKVSDSSVGKDEIFIRHHVELSDQIKVLQKALANSRGDNLLRIATLSSKLDEILEKIGILESCNRYLPHNSELNRKSQSLGDAISYDDTGSPPNFN